MPPEKPKRKKKGKQLFFDFDSPEKHRQEYLKFVTSKQKKEMELRFGLSETAKKIQEKYSRLLVGFEKDDFERAIKTIDDPKSTIEDLRFVKSILLGLEIDLQEKVDGKDKTYFEKLRDGDY